MLQERYDVLVPVRDVETSHKKIETEREKEPRPVSTRHLSPISSPGKDDEKRYLLMYRNSSCLPSTEIPWRGCFILGAATPAQMEFIGWFQARPPRKVHPKVVTISQKMPPFLEADLLPRTLLWTDLFQDHCPDLQDIALYFFPDDHSERLRENHARLMIERMEKQDLMMRICTDCEGVELLIFTSIRLKLDSRIPESFLWGVFCCIKKDQAPYYKVHEGLPSMVDQANMDENEIVDMEIDMIGGHMVGRQDIVVSRDPKVTRKTETSSAKIGRPKRSVKRPNYLKDYL